MERNEKKSLILHIGHPKTGTTALQSVLAANAARLLEVGVLYPTAATPVSHKHELAKPYLTGRENGAIRRRTGLEGEALARLSERYWSSLKAEIRHPHNIIVLSAEGLWAVPARRWPSFSERLSEICDNVTVVAYLRSPARRFLSQMNQRVRMFRGVLLPPPEYYRSVVEAYRENGFDSIKLNVFEPASLVGGDIVADFCQKYLPAELEPLDRESVERGNESVSNEALAILDETRRRYPALPNSAIDRGRAKMVALLRAADRDIGGNLRPSLKPGVANAIVAGAKDLCWLRDHCGVQFKDVDYDLAESTGHAALGEMRRVSDFCPIDAERLDALRAITGRKIKRLCEGGPLRRFVRGFLKKT